MPKTRRYTATSYGLRSRSSPSSIYASSTHTVRHSLPRTTIFFECAARITKTGNTLVRRVLVEVAWHYQHRPGVGLTLKRRREGQAARVIAIADKAQQRLCRRFRRRRRDGWRRGRMIARSPRTRK
jgi:hypothetical protein